MSEKMNLLNKKMNRSNINMSDNLIINSINQNPLYRESGKYYIYVRQLSKSSISRIGKPSISNLQ